MNNNTSFYIILYALHHYYIINNNFLSKYTTIICSKYKKNIMDILRDAKQIFLFLKI